MSLGTDLNLCTEGQIMIIITMASSSTHYDMHKISFVSFPRNAFLRNKSHEHKLNNPSRFIHTLPSCIELRLKENEMKNYRYIFSCVPDRKKPWNFTCEIGRGRRIATRWGSCESPIPCYLHIRFDFLYIVLPTEIGFEWTFYIGRTKVHIFLTQNCNSFRFWRSTVF